MSPATRLARHLCAAGMALVTAGLFVAFIAAAGGPDDRDRDTIPADQPAPVDLRRLDPENRRPSSSSRNGAEPEPVTVETRKAA